MSPTLSQLSQMGVTKHKKEVNPERIRTVLVVVIAILASSCGDQRHPDEEARAVVREYQISISAMSLLDMDITASIKGSIGFGGQGETFGSLKYQSVSGTEQTIEIHSELETDLDQILLEIVAENPSGLFVNHGILDGFGYACTISDGSTTVKFGGINGFPEKYFALIRGLAAIPEMGELGVFVSGAEQSQSETTVWFETFEEFTRNPLKYEEKMQSQVDCK